jgi:hypothetical protein
LLVKARRDGGFEVPPAMSSHIKTSSLGK